MGIRTRIGSCVSSIMSNFCDMNGLGGNIIGGLMYYKILEERQTSYWGPGEDACTRKLMFRSNKMGKHLQP